MSWLNDLLGFGKSEAEIEAEAFPSVSGTYRQQFSFVYSHKHWLDGNQVEHHITGDIALGVNFYGGNVQRWSILMNNVECDWTLPCSPEIYLFFNCVQRIECYVDAHGNILEEIYPISQNILLKEKKQLISKYVKDAKQASALLHFFSGNLGNNKFVQEMLPLNPVIKTLINTLLIANIENKPIGVNQIAEDYAIPGYFGNQASLPIKACWLHKEPLLSTDENLWVRTGGLDEKKYKEQNLQKLLNLIIGKPNIGSVILVDFSEIYRLAQGARLNATLLRYAERYLETTMAEGWYKEEQVIIQAVEPVIGKEENHGEG